MSGGASAASASDPLGGGLLLHRLERMGFFVRVLAEHWWAAATPVSGDVLALMRVLVQASNGSLQAQARAHALAQAQAQAQANSDGPAAAVSATTLSVVTAALAPLPRAPSYLYTEAVLQTLLLLVYSPAVYPRAWRADAALVLRGMSAAVVAWNARAQLGLGSGPLHPQGQTQPHAHAHARHASTSSVASIGSTGPALYGQPGGGGGGGDAAGVSERLAILVAATAKRRARSQSQASIPPPLSQSSHRHHNGALEHRDGSEAGADESADLDAPDSSAAQTPPQQQPQQQHTPSHPTASEQQQQQAEHPAECNGGQPFSVEVVYEVLKCHLFDLSTGAGAGAGGSAGASPSQTARDATHTQAQVHRPKFASSRRELHMSLHAHFHPTARLESLRAFVSLLHGFVGAAHALALADPAGRQLSEKKKAAAHYLLSQRVEHSLMGVWERNLQLLQRKHEATPEPAAATATATAATAAADPDDLSKPIFDLLLFFSQFSASLQERLAAEAKEKARIKAAAERAELLRQSAAAAREANRPAKPAPVPEVAAELATLAPGAHVLNPRRLLAKQDSVVNARAAAEAAEEAALAEAAQAAAHQFVQGALAQLAAGPPVLPFHSSLLLCFHPSRPVSLPLLRSFAAQLHGAAARSPVLRGVLWRHEWIAVLHTLHSIAHSFFVPASWSAKALARNPRLPDLALAAAAPAAGQSGDAGAAQDQAQVSFQLQQTPYLAAYASLPAWSSPPHQLLLHVLETWSLLVSDGALYHSLHGKLRADQQQADEAAARDRRALHAAIYANTAPPDAQWQLPPLADEEDDDGTAPHHGLDAPVRALRLLLAVRSAEEEQRREQWLPPQQQREEEERAAGQLPRTDAATAAALLDQLEADAAALSESHSSFLQQQRTQAERELLAHRKRLRLLPSLMHPSLSFAPGSPTFHAARSPLAASLQLHSPGSTSPWRA